MNVRRLNVRLTMMRGRLEESARRAVEETAEAARDDARAFAPVDSGRLRDSIRAERHGLKAAVFTDCGYAAAVEFGTMAAPAQAFLRPAASVARERFVREARERACEALCQV